MSAKSEISNPQYINSERYRDVKKPASWKLQQEEVKKRAAHAIPSPKYISSLCFVKLHRTITKFKNFSDRGKQLPIFISLYFTAISLVSVRYEPASAICIFNNEKQHMQAVLHVLHVRISYFHIS